MERLSRSDELRKLLLISFSADELRRFVRFGPDGVTLAPELPGNVASHAQLAAAAVELFERVHLVSDPAFWRRLVRERELRAAEVEEVRVLYMIAGAPAMPPLAVPEDLHDALQVIGFFRELARLFDGQRATNLMHRAALDPSSLPPVYTPTPKAWWEIVARELRQGATSEPLRSLCELVRAAREDYPANPVVVRAGELTR